jgi:hypothetical protein
LAVDFLCISYDHATPTLHAHSVLNLHATVSLRTWTPKYDVRASPACVLFGSTTRFSVFTITHVVMPSATAPPSSRPPSCSRRPRSRQQQRKRPWPAALQPARWRATRAARRRSRPPSCARAGRFVPSSTARWSKERPSSACEPERRRTVRRARRAWKGTGRGAGGRGLEMGGGLLAGCLSTL